MTRIINTKFNDRFMIQPLFPWAIDISYNTKPKNSWPWERTLSKQMIVQIPRTRIGNNPNQSPRPHGENIWMDEIVNYITDVNATPPRRRKTKTQVPKTEDCANHFSRNKTPPTAIKHKTYSHKATLNSRFTWYFEWENRHPIWTYQNSGCWR